MPYVLKHGSELGRFKTLDSKDPKT
ncbi:uncharacterized protein G2W53_022125 [Senna tora]|uniref:Uncharacterized protein n=1 Tax=Senna tora TaxID=362788 RepID=A0A834TMZ1_9FABA|nr:uncharacterized protein G2W53_022125 [Senna tora]